MDIDETYKVMPGCVNPNAGNSTEHFTGSLRKGMKPEFNEATCINCFFCWVFCPENAIMTEEEKITGINYDYCKGCGLCAHECPVKQEPKPIIMIKEISEL
jgi:pyruvate ferredoxin oxidoreductase delta subunit